MNDHLDQEYLSRPLIEKMTYEISDTSVQISCPHTCFVAVRIPAQQIEKAELLAQYRRVIRMAKERKTRISYKNHTKRTIIERWGEYEMACKAQENLFRQLIEKARQVQIRGIHMGCSDDSVLSELEMLSSKLNSYHYGNSIISIIAACKTDLTQHESNLSKTSTYYDMIFI